MILYVRIKLFSSVIFPTHKFSWFSGICVLVGAKIGQIEAHIVENNSSHH